jgi:hypothetical protein
MHRTIISVVLLIGLLLSACSAASARNFTGETGNKATFETLEEAHQNSPAVVKTYQGGNTMPPPGTPGFGARVGAPQVVPRAPRAYAGHPALNTYPKGTTFVYRSPNMYGGRATARMNTNLIVYVEQHFDTKDAALAYLKSAGLIEIADEATGSVVLVTPVGKTFGSDDVAPYYALQTAMLAQYASGVQADGSSVTYADAEYFGGFAYVYFIGVYGGATFFNNYVAGTFDFASRIAGALLIGGRMNEVRKVSTFIPVYLMNASEAVIEKYKTANHVNAVKGAGQRRPSTTQPGAAAGRWFWRSESRQSRARRRPTTTCSSRRCASRSRFKVCTARECLSLATAWTRRRIHYASATR